MFFTVPDYHSHLGTKRAGLGFFIQRYKRAIRSLEDGYFRNKFENDIKNFSGRFLGIGVISDTEAQSISWWTRTWAGLQWLRWARLSISMNLKNISLTCIILFRKRAKTPINPTELIAILIAGEWFCVGNWKCVQPCEKVPAPCWF